MEPGMKVFPGEKIETVGLAFHSGDDTGGMMVMVTSGGNTRYVRLGDMFDELKIQHGDKVQVDVSRV